MSNAVTHAFSCGLADDAAAAAAGEVVISNWNAQHTFAGATANGQFLIAASGETTGVVWTGGLTYATPNLSLASGQMLLPDGALTAPGLSASATPTTGLFFSAGNIVYTSSGTARVAFLGAAISFRDTSTLSWTSSTDTLGTQDLFLGRDAANTLALRNGTAAQTYNVYATYTSASDYVRTAFIAGTATTSIAIQGAGATGGSANRDLALTTLGTGILVIGNATNSAAAAVGTLTNSPVTGNPTWWLAVSVGGNVRYIPCF